MKRKVWNLRLDDGFHSVALDHGVWFGERTITVDGQVVERTRTGLDFGSQHPIEIAGYPGTVIIRSNGLTYTYDLIVNGRSLRTGQPVVAEPEAPAAGFPCWGWVFIAACAMIPLLSAGGALSAAIGLGGAMACAGMLRDEARSELVRLMLCFSVTFFCWVLFAGVIVGTATL
jgi:hypothetical protein